LLPTLPHLPKTTAATSLTFLFPRPQHHRRSAQLLRRGAVSLSWAFFWFKSMGDFRRSEPFFLGGENIFQILIIVQNLYIAINDLPGIFACCSGSKSFRELFQYCSHALQHRIRSFRDSPSHRDDPAQPEPWQLVSPRFAK